MNFITNKNHWNSYKIMCKWTIASGTKKTIYILSFGQKEMIILILTKKIYFFKSTNVQNYFHRLKGKNPRKY